MNVAAFLSHAARIEPHRTAVRHGQRRLSYAELEELANQFSSAVIRRGLRRGDRVALFMGNCPEYVIAMFGALSAGLVLLPINAKLTAAELEVILCDSEARMLVRGPGALDADTSSVDVVVCVGDADGLLSFSALLAEGDSARSHADVAADDLAWLFYTSGTTGRPKGAELSHRNLAAMTWLLLADVCDPRPDDVVLHVAPLSHASGLYLFGSIARGAENLIYDRVSFEPSEVLQLIERERVTVIAFLAPTMIIMLLAVELGADTSSLRCVVYGGAPIHARHAQQMIHRFGPVFVQIYGQGESPMIITYLDPAGHDSQLAGPSSLLSAGIPHPGIEVQIVDEEDQAVPPGIDGEVWVRGDVVMSGYWNDPPATAQALRSGWLHTGDIGRWDEHGRLFLLDRRNDTIISGGTNIYPREVEEVLVQHAGVSEAVVFGVPDDVWGERVAAAIVPVSDPPPTEEELLDHCRSRIASFKKPRSILYTDELPRNAYGKVLRRTVRDSLVASTRGQEP